MNSITQLKSLLDNQANAKAISACCARILHLEEEKVHDNTAAEEDEDDATVIPAEIKNIVTTTYLRSLLNLGKYSQVVDYCRKQTREQQQPQPPPQPQQEQSFATEQAYALYRLRNYHACRDLCERHGCAAATTTASGEAASSMGLLHIYAQTLYRLGETKSTDLIYRQLLLRGSSTTATDDVDEREDALSNALANGTANYTPGCCAGAAGGGNSSSIYSWLEEQEEVCQLLKDYGNDNANNNNNDNGNDNDGGEEKEELLQNYDLAYNLATFLLVSSESRSRSKVVQAKTLLGHAEASALTILESSSDDNNAVNGDDNGNGDEGEKEKAAKEKKQKQQQKQQQQLQLAEQEAGPIRANLALANLLLGGEENEMAALRTYLTLVTKAAAAAKGGNSNSSSSSSGGNNKGNANLIATASNNLACIRDGKESVFDVLKRIPTTSSLSVSEDNIGGGAAATMVVPLVGATPQQVRTALFNRALQFAKMGNSGGCHEALAVLRASLLVSSHGDGDAARSNNVSSGGGGGGETKNANVGGGSSKKNSKGKKKKGAGATASGSAGGGGSGDGSTKTSVSGEDVPTAKPSTEIEAIAWRARADWIESELLRLTSSSSSSDSANKKTSDELINGAIANLDKAIKVYKNDDASGILPYTKSQLLLHRAVVANPQSKTHPLIAALESLPSEVQSCPGTIVTLASLYGSSNSSEESTSRAEELLSSLGNEGLARLALAEFRLEKGQYEEAAELLQQIVDNADSTDSVEAMTATALLVRALSYVDPEKAAELAEDLQEEMMMQEGDEELDGEALESMDIPRFAKKAMGARGGGEGGSSSKVRKLIEATGGKRGSNLGERKKKNREVILRKRAKQREAYLSHLQSEGRYNPDQTPLAKPDPERWIPKSQRSYNRRGRRGRVKSNIGAQGGGAGAGMEKEAAKLDVAARVAAAKAGIVEGSGKPSTANVKVSESGAVRKGKGGRRR